MHSVITPPYNNIVPGRVETHIIDHMGGFDSLLQCQVLDLLSQKVAPNHRVVSEYIFLDLVKQNYPNLNFFYSKKLWKEHNFSDSFSNYTIHPELTFQNFICSFNGTDHIGRKLLVSILNQCRYFNPNYCSKNFIFTTDKIDGHITDLVHERDQFYRKFFIENNSETFFNTIYSFGHVRFNHLDNIYNLEHKLTNSFLHIVSETASTSYHPFITEKFLYSVVTRGLFLAYAQPGWHDYLEKYFGFKKYTKLFDYKFDAIQNPVERLIELMAMISKFRLLSSDDWRDLYNLEIENIEYNHNHYYSQDYLKCLAKIQ